MNVSAPRSRLVYALLIAVVIILGLASRAKSSQAYLPPFISEYAGDTLWALTAFLGFGFLLPRLSTWRVAALTFGFAVLIEVSQLYQAPWIDALRHTRLGALILGFGFLWSDLVCYAVGVACGVGLELLHRRSGSDGFQI
ncbi:MAG TPA: DUF2809 domain-containing protein [Blastocatellia bacterium]|nr:DUF2809 domain-containing protein [Blastocatellia bacterium]